MFDPYRSMFPEKPPGFWGKNSKELLDALRGLSSSAIPSHSTSFSDIQVVSHCMVSAFHSLVAGAYCSEKTAFEAYRLLIQNLKGLHDGRVADDCPTAEVPCSSSQPQEYSNNDEQFLSSGLAPGDWCYHNNYGIYDSILYPNNQDQMFTSLYEIFAKPSSANIDEFCLHRQPEGTDLIEPCLNSETTINGIDFVNDTCKSGKSAESSAMCGYHGLPLYNVAVSNSFSAFHENDDNDDDLTASHASPTLFVDSRRRACEMDEQAQTLRKDENDAADLTASHASPTLFDHSGRHAYEMNEQAQTLRKDDTQTSVNDAADITTSHASPTLFDDSIENANKNFFTLPSVGTWHNLKMNLNMIGMTNNNAGKREHVVEGAVLCPPPCPATNSGTEPPMAGPVLGGMLPSFMLRKSSSESNCADAQLRASAGVHDEQKPAGDDVLLTGGETFNRSRPGPGPRPAEPSQTRMKRYSFKLKNMLSCRCTICDDESCCADCQHVCAYCRRLDIDFFDFVPSVQQ